MLRPRPRPFAIAGALVEPLELLEHGALAVGRNAEAGVPHLDAQRAGNAPAADQNLAGGGCT